MKTKLRYLERLSLYCFADGGDGGDGGGGGDVPEFMQSLTDDDRAHIEKNGYGTASAEELTRHLLDSDIGAIKKLGRPASELIIKPSGEYAENKDAFLDVLRGLGAPESAEGYGEAPVMDGLAFKDGMWGKMTEMFAANGVPQFMVGPVLEGVADLVKAEAGETQSPEDLAKQRETEGMDALTGELGAAKAKAMVKDGTHLLEQKAEAEFVEYLAETGLGSDPRLIKFLGKVSADYAESGLIAERDGQGQGGGVLSKSAATEKLAALERDPGFLKQLNTKSDPNHATAVKQRVDLMGIING